MLLLVFQVILILLLCGSSYGVSEFLNSPSNFWYSSSDTALSKNPVPASHRMDKLRNKDAVDTTFASSISNPSNGMTPSSKSSSSLLSHLPSVLRRIPRALTSSVRTAVGAQISFSKVTIPLALVLNVKSISTVPLSEWAVGGLKTGMQWSRFTALQRGGQSLFEILRNKKDRVNMYLGSGLASSIPMYHQGPVVMGKAFVQGFTVMAVLDQTMKVMGGSLPAGIANDNDNQPAAAMSAPITTVRPVLSLSSSSSSSFPPSCGVDTLKREYSDSEGFNMFMMDDSCIRSTSLTTSSASRKTKPVFIRGAKALMLGK